MQIQNLWDITIVKKELSSKIKTIRLGSLSERKPDVSDNEKNKYGKAGVWFLESLDNRRNDFCYLTKDSQNRRMNCSQKILVVAVFVLTFFVVAGSFRNAPWIITLFKMRLEFIIHFASSLKPMIIIFYSAAKHVLITFWMT